MGQLTTHVLDTLGGRPGAGVRIRLLRDGALLGEAVTGSNGRTETPLLADAAFRPARYRLEFAVGDYYRGIGVALPEPAFLDIVPIDFGVADAAQHYHVPLLISPFAYSTYRGS